MGDFGCSHVPISNLLKVLILKTVGTIEKLRKYVQQEATIKKGASFQFYDIREFRGRVSEIEIQEITNVYAWSFLVKLRGGCL